jgi:hypothetical protein
MLPILAVALAVKGTFVIIDPETADQFAKEHVHTWSLDVRPFDGKAAIFLGVEMNRSGVLDKNGIGDQFAINVTHARFLIESTFMSGTYTAGAAPGQPILVTGIAGLPSQVILALGGQIQSGPVVSAEDIDALKKPQPPSTKSTAA